MSLDPGAFAELLCDYCLAVRAGQQVLVQSTTLAAPLMLALQRAVMEREAWPLLRPSLAEQEVGFWQSARDVHVDTVPSSDQAEAEAIDALLRIDAPFNTRALAGVDPALMTRAALARASLREVLLSRRWCGTLWPTAAGAQQAGMSSADFSAFVERALFLDRDDPIAAWGELSAMQEQMIGRLSAASTIRIQAEGTDLTLSVAGRSWVNSDGKRNMPSGEVFTGPVEDSAEGHIRFDIPSSPRGVEVAGIDLEFREGRVVSARAERGDEVLQAMLDTDDGARVLGELGIGTNLGVDRPIGSIMVDEKIGGTVHLAVGRSYPETGGTNVSAIHWDMICDLRQGGSVTADGTPVVVDGAVVQSD